MTKSYPTRLINDRRKPVDVYEMDGGVIVRLEAGQSFDVESCSAETMYARWSSVKWTDDGPHFVSRSNFVEPDRGRWLLRLCNEGNKEVEFRMIGGEQKMVPDPDPLKGVSTGGGPIERPLVRAVVGGRKICLPKGVPVLVGLQVTDRWARFKSLTIMRKRVMLKDPEHEGYCIFETISKDEEELRSDSELKALAKIIDELGRK